MLSARLACLMIALALLLWQGVRPALAQQEKERRVFTNEDVESPPRSAPAAAEPAAESVQAPSTSAAQPGTPAEAVPEGERVAEPGTEAPPSSSQMSIPQRLKSARFLQETLRRYLTEYSENLEAEADPARQQRWRDMMSSLMSLMQKNEQYISDLDQQLAEQESQASSQP